MLGYHLQNADITGNINNYVTTKTDEQNMQKIRCQINKQIFVPANILSQNTNTDYDVNLRSESSKMALKCKGEK
jgi:hypothetical protein